jgi:hypothetical protein
MVTIFWNPFGIHVFNTLPEKTSFDAGYFVDYVLISIAELPVMHTVASRKQKLVIHMDNSPIHKLKAAIQKNFVNASQNHSSYVLLTGSGSIKLLSFRIYQAKDRRSRIRASR